MVWWDERISVPLTATATRHLSGSASDSHADDAAHASGDASGACIRSAHGGRGGSGGAHSLHATIDLDDEYLRRLVADAFGRRPGWRADVVDGRGETIAPEASTSSLHWGEYERMDWGRIHAGEQAASCYCMRKGLIRKAHLAHNLKKWAAKHPQGRIAGAVPETFILSIDDEDYIDEALCDLPEVRDMVPGSAIWIAKPSITNQGAGVAVFDSCSGLRSVLAAEPDLLEWVVQRYVERPLLVGGRKFHLRAYVLCVGKLRVYVYSEMLALFAGAPYDSSLTNLSNLCSHLTNTCRQADAGGISGSSADSSAGPSSRMDGSGASGADAGGSSGSGSTGGSAGSSDGGGASSEEDVVRLFSELPELLAAEGMPLAEARRRVADAAQASHDILGEALEAVSHELTFFPLPGCFELFGADLLLDEEWRPWLLEFNAEPDFAQTGERLKGLVSGLVESTLQLVADPLAAGKGASGAPTTGGGLDGSGNGGADARTAGTAVNGGDDGGGGGTDGGGRTATVLRQAGFVEVFRSREGGVAGPSGIRMH